MIMKLPFINGEEKSFINTNKKHKGTDRIHFFFNFLSNLLFFNFVQFFKSYSYQWNDSASDVHNDNYKNCDKNELSGRDKIMKLSLILIFRSKWSQVIIVACYMVIREMTGDMILIIPTNCKAKHILNIPNRNQL